MDFVHDQLANERKILILMVVDTFSRYVTALDAQFSYRSEDVSAILDRVCGKIGYPKIIRANKGGDFLLAKFYAYQTDATLYFPLPGKATDNSYNEKYNQTSIRMPRRSLVHGL